jgi:4-diphosphocytidyl-2-C-methyl-D-erythritol kinase
MFHVHAPAKLNLSLRILGQRSDGFHALDTVMIQLPGLADELSFTESENFSFHCDDLTIPVDDGNLVVKAVQAYSAAAQFTYNGTISLKKNIPHGAGLGGGSSNAAHTLLALNSLNHSKLSQKALHEVAASLGSDIPFFLTSGPARCTGRGEIIQTLDPLPALNVLLLKPTFSVPTVDAYRRWKSSLEIPGIRYSEQSVPGISLFNDLERPVFEKYRFLSEIKEWLLNRSEVHAALMSGSGSTVFAILHDDTDGAQLADFAKSELDPTLWHWTGLTGQ